MAKWRYQILLNGIRYPDLWEYKLKQKLNDEPISNIAFTEMEKSATKKALNEFKIYVLQTHQVTIEQKAEIEEKIDYLIQSVDRLNKFDWKGIATSTVIGIITTLSLDTQKGNELWNFFVNLLKHLPQLVAQS